MAADVVPVLNERIERSFRTNMLRDRRVAQISKRIRDGTATFIEAHDYAERIGENLSRSFLSNLTEDALPDGRLYYNIANRTVVPALQVNHITINEAAEEIQNAIDLKNGIGLKSVRADFPKDRIQGLIDKMTADGITLIEAQSWLKEPLINNLEAFVDDFIKENAKVRSNAGLKTTITRIAAPGCCDWCDALAGTYEYGSEPQDVYRRHQFCRCTVTFQSKKTSQDVLSKKIWKSSEEEIERRKESGKKVIELSPEERLEQAARLSKDFEISDIQKEIGYSRKTIRRMMQKKDPEQLAKEIEKIKERQKLLRR